MEVRVTGELEAKLTHSAAQQGRAPDDLVQDVLTRYFEEEALTRGAGAAGDDQLRTVRADGAGGIGQPCRGRAAA